MFTSGYYGDFAATRGGCWSHGIESLGRAAIISVTAANHYHLPRRTKDMYLRRLPPPDIRGRFAADEADDSDFSDDDNGGFDSEIEDEPGDEDA